MYRSSLMEFGELSDEDERLIDIIDEIRRLAHLYAIGTTEGTQLFTRPQHLRERKAAADMAREANRRIEEIEWEEV